MLKHVSLKWNVGDLGRQSNDICLNTYYSIRIDFRIYEMISLTIFVISLTTILCHLSFQKAADTFYPSPPPLCHHGKVWVAIATMPRFCLD